MYSCRNSRCVFILKSKFFFNCDIVIYILFFAAHGSGDSELASSYGNNTSELLKQTIDIIDSPSSPPVAQHANQSLSRDLFGSQLTNAMNDDVANSLKPLQMDSCDEAGSTNSSLPNGQSNGSDNLQKGEAYELSAKHFVKLTTRL